MGGSDLANSCASYSEPLPRRSWHPTRVARAMESKSYFIAGLGVSLSMIARQDKILMSDGTILCPSELRNVGNSSCKRGMDVDKDHR